MYLPRAQCHMKEHSRLHPRYLMYRAGATPVGCLHFRTVSNLVWGAGRNGLLIHTAQPELPEIHSGQLPASHMDLAFQLGL
jgi:hypothetical protein